MTLGNKLQNELYEIVTAGSGTAAELETHVEQEVRPTHQTILLDSNVFLSAAIASDVSLVGSMRLIAPPPGRMHGPTLVELQAEIDQLKAQVTALEQEVTQLKAAIPEEQVIVLRSITREQAKGEILELFQSSQTLYYSDIAQQLRLDLPLVVEICQELYEGGDIEVDANYANGDG